MSRLILAALLFFTPLLAQAVSGSWSKKTAGGVVSVGRQIHASPLIIAPATVSDRAITRRIAWRIILLSPPPLGLEIKLCSEETCLLLNRLAGEITPPPSFSPRGRYRFIYSVNRKGTLLPALNVVSNQLTLSYHQP